LGLILILLILLSQSRLVVEFIEDGAVDLANLAKINEFNIEIVS
jgi:hypothetical protein